MSQRRGRGTTAFRTPSHRYIGEARNKVLMTKEIHFADVISLIHSPAHSAPLAFVKYDDGEKGLMIAPENLAVGDKINVGGNEIKPGNTLKLSEIPEGTPIYNIEQSFGDGGKFVRSSGTAARVMARIGDKVNVMMPSKKIKIFNANCRATIGTVAGGGRTEKPFIKAGIKMKAMLARGKLFPVTSAVAMNANEHPFGCGRGRHVGKPKNAPRHAPPGRKVGILYSKRTGRKKGR